MADVGEAGGSEAELEDLVAEALEAHDRDGEAGVDAVCAAHPHLATRLRGLLRGLLAIGVVVEPKQEVPERLGDFRLLRRIGGGGMGVVFEAEQQNPRRRVALKIVRPELWAQRTIRERFRREVTAVARLHHPAIVPVLASGESGGVPYLAMTLVDGLTVDAAVRALADRRPQELRGADLRAVLGPADGVASDVFDGAYWEACVRLVRQVADALGHAHRCRVVHRDVKPSNVMLTADGRAMLLDFGLAHVQDVERLTRTGSQLGSPAYMSPEQIHALPVDERTDVYALAATLHALLALEAPFPLGDPGRLRDAILGGVVTPLRGRNPAVPRDLALVLRIAMDIDRERRHPGMGAFVADLDAVLERRPIRTRAIPTALRVLRWTQRHRLATGALAVLLVTTLVTPVVLWSAQRSANVEIGRQAEFASRSLGTVLDGIERLEQHVRTMHATRVARSVARALEMQRDILEMVARVAAEGAADPVTVARVARLRVAVAEVTAAVLPGPEARTASDDAHSALADTPGIADAERAVLAVRLAVVDVQNALVAGEIASARAMLRRATLALAAAEQLDASASELAGVRSALARLELRTAETAEDPVARHAVFDRAIAAARGAYDATPDVEHTRALLDTWLLAATAAHDEGDAGRADTLLSTALQAIDAIDAQHAFDPDVLRTTAGLFELNATLRAAAGARDDARLAQRTAVAALRRLDVVGSGVPDWSEDLGRAAEVLAALEDDVDARLAAWTESVDARRCRVYQLPNDADAIARLAGVLARARDAADRMQRIELRDRFAAELDAVAPRPGGGR